MNQRNRWIVMIAIIALAAVTLAVVLARRGVQPAPTTEGERAAAAVGQEYIAYRPREAECDELVDGGKSESCVWPKDITPIARPEWEQLFPNTDFYLVGLAGRNQVQSYDHAYYLELAAWCEDKYYSAETFDHLLKANGVTEITDENRELVAKAFALMTIPDYLEEEVLFTEWGETDWPAGFGESYNWHLSGWTKIQGLKIWWLFMFGDGQLWATDGGVAEENTGDCIDVSFEALPRPSSEDFLFSFRRN
jgi:hypothetical protein